jgi:hypothetical protein
MGRHAEPASKEDPMSDRRALRASRAVRLRVVVMCLSVAALLPGAARAQNTAGAGPLEPGTAHVVTAGDVAQDVVLPQSSVEFPGSDGSFDLQWQDASRNTLNLTLDLAAGEVVSSFAAVGVPGTSIVDAAYFADFLRDVCSLSVEVAADSVMGRLECPGLSNADGTATIDLVADFSALAAPVTPSAGPSTPPIEAGMARFTTTGAVARELLLPQAAASDFPGDEGTFDVDWSDEAGDLLRITLDMSGGQLQSVFVAVGVPGGSIVDPDYYADAFRSVCDVRLTRYDEAAVEGVFTCAGLPNGDESRSIDAYGSFSALP